MADRPFVTENHIRVRNTLRVMGPIVFIVGSLFAVVAGVDFFSCMGTFQQPHYFWMFFIGMPLMFVGGVLSMNGYAGAMMRYTMQEGVPVTTESANYIATETAPAMRTSARAIAAGIRDAANETGIVYCGECGHPNPADAKFCNNCGKPIAILTSTKP